MAVNQLITAQPLGLFGDIYALNAPAKTTFALSATTNWLALSFIPMASKQVTNLRVFVSAVSTVNIVAANMTAEIESDSSGVPSNADVTGGTAQAVSAAPTAAGWVNFTGFTANVTAGTPYWVVFKSSDATNFPTYQWITNLLNTPFGTYGWQKRHTTNSGTTWGTLQNNISVLRVGYSDGSYDGYPVSNFAQSSTVQGATEIGAKFTLPGTSSLTYKIAGISLPVFKANSPTNAPVFNLYVGNSTTTPTASTSTAAPTLTNSGTYGQYVNLYFSSTQSVVGGSVVRITLADSGTDTGANGYTLAPIVTFDTDTNSDLLLPFEGTWQQTSLSGGVWTDTQNNVPYGGLLLDSTGELTAAAAAGGGGIIQTSIYWEV